MPDPYHDLKERFHFFLGCLLLFLGLPLCMVAMYFAFAAVPGLGLIVIFLCLLRSVLADHRAALAASQRQRRAMARGLFS